MKPLELFYDPQDMTTCVLATTTVAELNRKAAGDGLYFPLYLTQEMEIGDLVLGYRFASRSYRFGPLCDNVLGFNFVLPSGKMVKVGAQVVKNVTGFDFARFLTNSGYRFGSVERVVLRLRVLAQTDNFRGVAGPWESLEEFRREILGSASPATVAEGAHGGPVRHSRASQKKAYGQVIDAFDFIFDGEGHRFELSFSCDQPQVELFDRALAGVAQETGCQYTRLEKLSVPTTHPFARVKTLISKCTSQAKKLVEELGGRAHGFLGNAFFHYDPPDAGRLESPQLAVLQSLHEEVSSVGGHVRCEKLTYPDSIELQWERKLRERWEALP